MIDEAAIRARYAVIKDRLDERGRRLFVAAEKIAAGYGGTAAVARATGVADSTIIRSVKDLAALTTSDRVRRKGGGRPPLSRSDPAVLEDLRLRAALARMQDAVTPVCAITSCAAPCRYSGAGN
jgi:hypothetical protein